MSAKSLSGQSCMTGIPVPSPKIYSTSSICLSCRLSSGPVYSFCSATPILSPYHHLVSQLSVSPLKTFKSNTLDSFIDAFDDFGLISFEPSTVPSSFVLSSTDQPVPSHLPPPSITQALSLRQSINPISVINHRCSFQISFFSSLNQMPIIIHLH